MLMLDTRGRTDPNIRFVVGVLLLGVVASVLLVVALSPRNRPADGPVPAGPEHGFSVTRPTGTVLTDGFEVLYVEGEAPAVISDVELVNAEGFRLVGAMVAGADRKFDAVQLVDRWPPVADELDGVELVDAIGATLSPTSENERGWELFLGIEVTGEGLLIRDGVRVDYEVDGHLFTVELPAQLVVCTDASVEVRKQCPLHPTRP
jgi:hypothetical protein